MVLLTYTEGPSFFRRVLMVLLATGRLNRILLLPKEDNNEKNSKED